MTANAIIKPAQIPAKIPFFAEEVTRKCEKKSGRIREKVRNKTGDCENFRENFQDIARKKHIRENGEEDQGMMRLYTAV